jgi:hypothetical protein
MFLSLWLTCGAPGQETAYFLIAWCANVGRRWLVADESASDAGYSSTGRRVLSASLAARLLAFSLPIHLPSRCVLQSLNAAATTLPSSCSARARPSVSAAPRAAVTSLRVAPAFSLFPLCAGSFVGDLYFLRSWPLMVITLGVSSFSLIVYKIEPPPASLLCLFSSALALPLAVVHPACFLRAQLALPLVADTCVTNSPLLTRSNLVATLLVVFPLLLMRAWRRVPVAPCWSFVLLHRCSFCFPSVLLFAPWHCWLSPPVLYSLSVPFPLLSSYPRLEFITILIVGVCILCPEFAAPHARRQGLAVPATYGRPAPRRQHDVVGAPHTPSPVGVRLGIPLLWRRLLATHGRVIAPAATLSSSKRRRVPHQSRALLSSCVIRR